MEPFLKVKPHTLRRMDALLAPGEQVVAAVPCGRMDLDANASQRSQDRDYLVVTDRRLLSVPGAWFRKGKGALSFLRTMILDTEMSTHVLGSTITVHIRPIGNAPARSVPFTNVKKNHAEHVYKLLGETYTGRLCKACGKPLNDDFAMCPFCQASLKRVCSKCGRPMQDTWVACPFCGGS